MKELKFKNLLIIGKEGKKTEKITRMLGGNFVTVSHIPGLSALKTSEGMTYDLVIVTDASEDKPDREFGRNLRQVLPEARVLGVYNEISEETEKNLRTAGLVFLGSYADFQSHYRDILYRLNHNPGLSEGGKEDFPPKLRPSRRKKVSA